MILLFLIGAVGLGRLIVNSLHLAWHRFEAWALTLVFGYFFGAWSLLLACAIFGFEIGAIVTLIFILGCWLVPLTRRSPSLLSFATPRQTLAWLISTGTFSLLITDLLYRQMMGPGPGGTYSAGATGMDLPLHLSIMSNVAYATRFNWHFSLMAHTYLTYHFLIDFLSGMIVRWGGSLHLGLLLVSIPLCLSLVQLLFFLGYRALKNVRAASLFTTIFLLNGSSFGFVLAIIDFFHSKSNLRSFFREPPRDYVRTTFAYFDNFITTSLIDQRAFQLGLPIVCSIIILAYLLHQEMGAKQQRRILLLMGSAIGLLPLAHVYSFLMSVAILVVLAVLGREMIKIREWLVTTAVIAVISVPQLLYQTYANRHIRFVYFHPGWQFDDSYFPYLSYSSGLLLYFLINFGVICPLVIFSYRHLKNHGLARYLVALGAMLFIAAFLFIFQPLKYDNIKFFIYADLFFRLGIAECFSQLSRSGKFQWIPLMLLVVASGFLSIVWQAHERTLLYPDNTFVEAREFRSRLPIDALVLTANDAKHPAWSLAGQPVVEGRIDYLWDYGLPAIQVGSDIKTMYLGGDKALALLQRYQVQYVVISRYERSSSLIVNEPFFAHHFPLIFQRTGVSIYKVRQG